MDIRLEMEEAAILRRVLSGYLSELRMEIRTTDTHRLRQELKREEVAIKRLLAMLEAPVAGPAT